MLTFALFLALGFTLFVGALLGLTWSVRSGQLDDLETPALRMLIDDPEPTTKDSKTSTTPPTSQDHP